VRREPEMGKNPGSESDEMEETKEFHRRYLRAVSNPVRRGILKALRGGAKAFEELLAETELEPRTLRWHLSILEDARCLERVFGEGGRYRLTQEGMVVDFIGD